MSEAPLESGVDGTPLGRLQPGERGVITRLEGDPSVVRRLMELGLVPGTEVEVVRFAPLRDPVELRVRGVHLSIRRSEAARIHVAPR
jgi:Fe2+ transport system protein FeoA